ncbi:MAG: MFS transporter [Thermoplasmataceae archaeon]
MTEEITSSGKVSSRTLYIISLNHFVNDSSTFLIASLFPAMEIAFGFKTYYIGILVAVGYMINVAFQPLTGMASQRFDPGKLLPLGISIMAVSMVLFAISGTFAMMMVSVIIMRIGSSFFHPVGATAISRTYSGNQLDSSMGIESAFGNLGMVFSFMLSAPLYLILGWTGPFLIYAALEFLTVIFTLFTLSRDSLVRERGKKTNVDEVNLPEIRSISRKTWKSGKKRNYFLYIPVFFVVTAFITGATNTVFGNFGNLLLFHRGLSISLSNDLIAIWVVFAFFGALVTGRLTVMMSRMKLLILSYIVSGMSCLSFALFSGNILPSTISLALNGFFLGIVYPATYSELGDLSSRLGSSGSSFGILFSSQLIGSSIFGYLGGYFSYTYGLASVFELTSFLLILSVGIVSIWSYRFRPTFLGTAMVK